MSMSYPRHDESADLPCYSVHNVLSCKFSFSFSGFGQVLMPEVSTRVTVSKRVGLFAEFIVCLVRSLKLLSEAFFLSKIGAGHLSGWSDA